MRSSPSEAPVSRFDPTLNPYVNLSREREEILFDMNAVWPLYADQENCVDLGCGNGHFLRDYLERRVNFQGLGVERRYKRLVKTADKLEVSRARVLRADIPEFLEASPDHFWNEVWLQFPDPWPKLRHEKNRMVTPAFFENIFRTLKDGGRFCFRSDCRLYWEQLQEWNTRFELFSSTQVLAGDIFAEEPQTLYLLKMQRNAVPVYSLEFRKLE